MGVVVVVVVLVVQYVLGSTKCECHYELYSPGTALNHATAMLHSSAAQY